jgi:hypothetical protein
LALLVGNLSFDSTKLAHDRVTNQAMARAKEAIIGWSANNAVPGRLPCPEDTIAIGTLNEGQAAGSCGLPAIGRLPWRTLGLGDIKDGNGDTLWYVISNGFRTSPINSDSLGQLTVDGVVNAAVAIIFSPGKPINGQTRPLPTAASPPDKAQYLDLTNGDGDNTFVTSGPINTFNDRLLSITADELFHVVEKRVAREVIRALDDYYCGVNNSDRVGNCIISGGNRFYPTPASFSDINCLGVASIPALCPSGSINHGRIPANPVPLWDSLSILNGSTPSWFQNNGWREQTYYAVALACTSLTPNCSGSSYLTLNNPSAAPLGGEKIIVIVSGRALSSQSTRPTNKVTETNYLEDENLTPLDDTFTLRPASSAIIFNDVVVGQP